MAAEPEPLVSWMSTVKPEYDKAVLSVSVSRRHRSFVAAGANADLPRLKFRYKTWGPTRGRDCYTEVLEVMDQSGALVPAADIYQYLRQQFCEHCALILALTDHIAAVDYVGDEFAREKDNLIEAFVPGFYDLDEKNHFDPLPGPLLYLFGYLVPPWEILLAQQARNHEREASLARMVCAQRLNVADAVNVIVGFLGGRIGVQTSFLTRDELRTAMNTLVASYNDQAESDRGGYCHALIQNDLRAGVFSTRPGHRSLRWLVHREGETESDTEDDEEPDLAHFLDPNGTAAGDLSD
jgi:hypothetical protein